MQKNTSTTTCWRGIRQTLGLLVLLALLAAGPACGGTDGGLGASGGPRGLILDTARVVAIYDVKSYLEAPDLPGLLLRGKDETGRAQEGFLDHWENGQMKNEFAIDLERVSTITNVYVANDDGTYAGYRVFRGELDLDAVKDHLEGGDFDEETYRDFPVWRHRSESTTLLLLEENGAYVVGHEDQIRDILKAVDRGEGFAGAETPMGRVLKAAGEGVWTTAFTHCKEEHYMVPYRNLYDFQKTLPLLSSLPRLLTGCEAHATTITGGDAGTSQAAIAVVFTSPRRAETGREDLRGYLEDSDHLDIDMDEARVKEDLLVLKLTVYE